MINAARIPHEREFHSGWYLRQLINATATSPANPSQTIHPASETGFTYARLSNSHGRNCIDNDYSVNSDESHRDTMGIEFSFLFSPVDI